uniref:Putative lectin subunit alpha-like protein n=1 Tax=Haematobia irritans TaxID=7368 RepID=A0A1L8ECE0_HAEIR
MYISQWNIVWILPIALAILHPVLADPKWYTAIDGREYLIETRLKYNWLKAHNECARRNLHLAVIDSADKNNAFVTLLRTIFDRTPNLWLGHHDALNSEYKWHRSFYSIVNGTQLNFSNWYRGEPDNNEYQEHCVHLYSKSKFQWNDGQCSCQYGYVCEKPQRNLQANCDFSEIRNSVYSLNKQLSKDHKIHAYEIGNILEDNRKESANNLKEFQQSTKETLDEAKQAVDDIIAQKPYLEAVMNDVGMSIKKIISEASDKILNNSFITHETINDNAKSTAETVGRKSSTFQAKLDENVLAVDRLLVMGMP